MDINIDQELCTRCDACLALCIARVFERLDGRIEVVATERCWLCGHCVAACPADAIAHSEYPIQECPALDPAVLPSLDGLVGVLRERRSSRVFRDRPVERQVVRELVDVARWGPSASNEQPVEWLAFDDPDRIAALRGQAVAALAQTVRLLRSRLLRPFLRLAYGPEQVEKGVENADAFEDLVECHARGEDLVFFHAACSGSCRPSILMDAVHSF
jgi:ferredoxin